MADERVKAFMEKRKASPEYKKKMARIEKSKKPGLMVMDGAKIIGKRNPKKKK